MKNRIVQFHILVIIFFVSMYSFYSYIYYQPSTSRKAERRFNGIGLNKIPLLGNVRRRNASEYAMLLKRSKCLRQGMTMEEVIGIMGMLPNDKAALVVLGPILNRNGIANYYFAYSCYENIHDIANSRKGIKIYISADGYLDEVVYDEFAQCFK